MKKIAILLFIIVFMSSFVFATTYTGGASIVYNSNNTPNGSTVNLGLKLSLSDVQYYEFGFSEDSSYSLDTSTTAISNIVLSKDEERSAGENIIASASFCAYWKVISFYNLTFYISSSGALNDGKTNNVDYTLYDSRNNTILDSDNYTNEVEIGTFSPDFSSLEFSSVGFKSFEMVTAAVQNAFPDNDIDRVYQTTFYLKVEVE